MRSKLLDTYKASLTVCLYLARLHSSFDPRTQSTNGLHHHSQHPLIPLFRHQTRIQLLHNPPKYHPPTATTHNTVSSPSIRYSQNLRTSQTVPTYATACPHRITRCKPPSDYPRRGESEGGLPPSGQGSAKHFPFLSQSHKNIQVSLLHPHPPFPLNRPPSPRFLPFFRPILDTHPKRLLHPSKSKSQYSIRRLVQNHETFILGVFLDSASFACYAHFYSFYAAGRNYLKN